MGPEGKKEFKIETKLQKIGHDGKGKMPFELMKFERQLQEFDVNTWKTWYRFLVYQLVSGCSSWIENKQTREPFRSIITT